MRIGPLEMRVVSDSGPLLRHIHAAVREFCVDDLSSPRILRLNNDPSWPPPGGPHWSPDQPFDRILDGSGDVAGVVRCDYADTEFLPVDGEFTSGTRFFLQTAAAIWLPLVDGIAFHASGFTVGALGLLAFGDSGTGKSTLARLSDGAFSDECTVAYLSADEWRVTGTPFPYRFDGKVLPGSHRLDALLTPLRAPPLELQPIATHAALQALARQAVMPGHGRELTERWLDLATRLVQTVPAYAFRFAADAGSMRFLREHLQPSREGNSDGADG